MILVVVVVVVVVVAVVVVGVGMTLFKYIHNILEDPLEHVVIGSTSTGSIAMIWMGRQ